MKRLSFSHKTKANERMIYVGYILFKTYFIFKKRTSKYTNTTNTERNRIRTKTYYVHTLQRGSSPIFANYRFLFQIYALTIALIVGCASALTQLQQEFNQFQLDYAKSYNTGEEYIKRYDAILFGNVSLRITVISVNYT